MSSISHYLTEEECSCESETVKHIRSSDDYSPLTFKRLIISVSMETMLWTPSLPLSLVGRIPKDNKL